MTPMHTPSTLNTLFPRHSASGDAIALPGDRHTPLVTTDHAAQSPPLPANRPPSLGPRWAQRANFLPTHIDSNQYTTLKSP